MSRTEFAVWVDASWLASGVVLHARWICYRKYVMAAFKMQHKIYKFGRVGHGFTKNQPCPSVESSDTFIHRFSLCTSVAV